jgi:hypothetical protein
MTSLMWDQSNSGDPIFLRSLSSDSVKNEGKQNVQKTSMDPGRDAQIFQQSRSHIKILGAVWVTWSKFHNDNP